jgi:iron(III) transport system substrate-binding protein
LTQIDNSQRGRLPLEAEETVKRIITANRSLAAVLATVALALSACGGSTPAPTGQASNSPEWQKVLDAAAKEGTVTMYAAEPPDLLQKLQDAWTKAYPNIKLNLLRDTASTTKVQQEEKSGVGGADVLDATDLAFFQDHDAGGLLLDLKGPAYDAFPKSGFLTSRVPIVTSLPAVIAYNTDMIKTPPKTYSDLLTPSLQGKLGAILVTTAPVLGAWYEYLRTTYGPELWTQIAAMKPKYYASSVPMTQAVASGEIAATFFSQTGSVAPLQAQGAPIKYVIPQGKAVFVVPHATVALKQAKHPNAAVVLTNFILSKSGQEAFNGGGQGISALPGIPGALTASGTLMTYDPKVLTPQRIAQINAEWAKVFQPK